MADVIFHIGMGKTGTSSIQAALQGNKDLLASRYQVKYLGMWFDLISDEYRGYDGQARFFSSSPEDMIPLAEKFSLALDALTEKGSAKFILSNEVIFGYPVSFSGFVDRLSDFHEIKVVAYARNPSDWLPSAYTQWAIFHKAFPGELLSFEEYARRAIKSYSGIVRWKSLLGDRFFLRPYIKTRNVVEDFASFSDVSFETMPSRVLERLSDAEIVLRGAFNRQYDTAVLPEVFNGAFKGLDETSRFSLDEYVRRSLDHSSVPEIVRENIALFQQIESQLGIDLTGNESAPREPKDLSHIRSEVLDLLVDVVVNQARSLQEVRGEVAELRREVRALKE